MRAAGVGLRRSVVARWRESPQPTDVRSVWGWDAIGIAPTDGNRAQDKSDVTEVIQMVANRRTAGIVRVGDAIETRGVHGAPSRRGTIVELLGSTVHRHYRVRWDEQHESIVYPADGVMVKPRRLGALARESD
jgi:hypothetical protein